MMKIDCFYSRINCNTYFLYNDNKDAIIVDPGYNKNNVLLDHINKLGLNIVAILLTHGHFDHISALEDVVKAFPDAITYIHEDERDFLTNKRLNLSFSDFNSGGKVLDFEPSKLKLVRDTEIISLLDKEILVIHTPFHTRGSTCFFIKDENILFSGDTLFYSVIGRNDLPTSSKRSVESSLRKLIVLPDEVKVYPGHGVHTSIGREKKYNMYLRNLITSL